MVTYKAYEFDRLLEPKRPRPIAVLLYGIDEGVIAIRAQHLMQFWLGKTTIREDIISIDGDEILSSSDALANALNSQSLFGGAQIVHAQIGTKNIAASLEQALTSGIHPLLMQAGDLKPTHALRKFCEAHNHIISLPCYAENEKDIARTVTSTLKTALLTADNNTQALIVSQLSANPQMSKIELEKLCIYMHGKNRVDQSDVLELLIDQGEHSADELIDALFLKQRARAFTLCQHLVQEGLHPSVIALLILRHTLILLKIQAMRAAGSALESIYKSLQPPIYPRRQTLITEHLKKVSRETLLNYEQVAIKALRDTRNSGIRAHAGLVEALTSILA